MEGVEPNLPPLILVHELAASTVNLEVRFWVNSWRQSFLQVTSVVTQAIKEQLQGANIEMLTEIYTLTFRDGSLVANGAMKGLADGNQLVIETTVPPDSAPPDEDSP